MANIDIFSIEPNKISRDLKGKFVLLYGEPKVGKTSLAAQFPKSLLCAFEVGYHALPGIHAIDMSSWADFKKVVQQLRLPQAKDKYETIIIDTYSIAVDLCEKYVLAQNDAKTLGDIPWGGGWTMFRKELAAPFREITQLGYGIVFICHSKDRPTEFVDKEGNTITGKYPDINKTGLALVNELVDIIGYLSVEFQSDGTNKRYFYTRQTPQIFAGSRYHYLEPKIEFGYDNLVNAIADAIEKEVANGAQVTDHTVLKEESGRTFEDVFSEAKSLWSKLVASNSVGNNVANVEKINRAIVEVVGNPKKLSEFTPDNQSQLEEIVEKMRNM